MSTYELFFAFMVSFYAKQELFHGIIAERRQFDKMFTNATFNVKETLGLPLNYKAREKLNEIAVTVTKLAMARNSYEEKLSVHYETLMQSQVNLRIIKGRYDMLELYLLGDNAWGNLLEDLQSDESLKKLSEIDAEELRKEWNELNLLQQMRDIIAEIKELQKMFAHHIEL